MIARLIARIFGTDNERQLQKFYPLVNRINAFEEIVSVLSDEQLSAKTLYFREQLAQGKTLDDILPEAFAVVREASKRCLGQRHFDVQLIGGIVLHQGKIAEMKTGEGKTLTATLPLYLNALSGNSVHLVTVNDYLARRDAQWMSAIYTFLGLSVGCLQNGMSDSDRKKAYAADILYATNNELGFDYLRDNMKFRLEDYVQRDLIYAIVDEVDSILIDEARTPLIISGSAEESSKLYNDANSAVSRLSPTDHYDVDEKQRSVFLNEKGVENIERFFSIDNLYSVEHTTLLHHVNQALRAHAIYKRDFDYIVKDDEVLIVDEFTGRILAGRRYSDGLHQALEAKEHVTIERESQTLASITLQNYFRMYKKLAGMTGTAATEAEEFYNIYKLPVISIPSNKPIVRQDKPDLIFLTKNAKYKAIVEDLAERYKKGQPVLIGTIAVETSELISHFLTSHGITHEVLNAKQHTREAEIIEQAGQLSHVTIATNMAGRGTDIKLTEESRVQGGLYILGTERHESRRIDNQLRGRSGRQGDPGESRFYISLEDDLIRRFAGDSLKKNMERFGMKEDEVIESPFITKTIEKTQEKVEKHNFEIRKHLIEYDDVLNQQRIVVYQYRRNTLEGEHNIYLLIQDFVNRVIHDIVIFHSAQARTISQDQITQILDAIEQVTRIDKSILKKASYTSNTAITSAKLIDDLTDIILENYNLYRNQHGESSLIYQAEKWLILGTIDTAWKQHMLNLDHLKEGIGLRGWGQKNPLIEYKREAFSMFQEMMENIRLTVVQQIFHLNVERFNERELEIKREKELAHINLSGPVDTMDPGVGNDVIAAVREAKVGRNEICPCGSGKKYKKCCGA